RGDKRYLYQILNNRLAHFPPAPAGKFFPCRAALAGELAGKFCGQRRRLPSPPAASTRLPSLRIFVHRDRDVKMAKCLPTGRPRVSCRGDECEKVNLSTRR